MARLVELSASRVNHTSFPPDSSRPSSERLACNLVRLGKRPQGFSRLTLRASFDADLDSEHEKQVLETPGVFWRPPPHGDAATTARTVDAAATHRVG
jgi:hypothetical protein